MRRGSMGTGANTPPQSTTTPRTARVEFSLIRQRVVRRVPRVAPPYGGGGRKCVTEAGRSRLPNAASPGLNERSSADAAGDAQAAPLGLRLFPCADRSDATSARQAWSMPHRQENKCLFEKFTCRNGVSRAQGRRRARPSQQLDEHHHADDDQRGEQDHEQGPVIEQYHHGRHNDEGRPATRCRSRLRGPTSGLVPSERLPSMSRIPGRLRRGAGRAARRGCACSRRAARCSSGLRSPARAAG